MVSQKRPYVRYGSGNRARGGSERRGEKRSPAFALTSLEIPVACRHTIFAGLQLIPIHRDAHRTAWFTPVRASRPEDIAQTLRLSLALNGHRTRNDHRPHAGFHFSAAQHTRSVAKIGNTAICA